MADGSTKLVETIQVGDRVLSYDESSAKMENSEVVSIHKPYVVDHYFIINEELSATENHPVLSKGEWINVGNLSVGDVLTSPDGWDIEIYTLRIINETVKVYNFQVESGTYIANDVIVHNKEDCEEYEQEKPD
jgi:intein/homing endonuclease